MCIYHLRFDLLVEALYVFYKRLRDAKVCTCGFPNIRYPADLRRTLVCARPQNSRYDKNECITTQCDHCGELQQLNICGCIDTESAQWLRSFSTLNGDAHRTVFLDVLKAECLLKRAQVRELTGVLFSISAAMLNQHLGGLLQACYVAPDTSKLQSSFSTKFSLF